jgi:hypothetical protein
MRWKPVASAMLSVASICTQVAGFWCASSVAITLAKGGQVNRTLASVAGPASTLAIVLALLALPLAVMSWPRERSSVRVSALCLAVGAICWSLLVI